MTSLKKKMKKEGGFTLIEMLIVVAIIAILVAVSIPLVNSALDKARIATDAANERSAKAAATIMYLDEEFTSGTVLNYDIATGRLSPDTPATYGKCSKHKGEYLCVTITKEDAANKKNAEIKVYWSGDATGADLDSLELTKTTAEASGS